MIAIKSLKSFYLLILPKIISYHPPLKLKYDDLSQFNYKLIIGTACAYILLVNDNCFRVSFPKSLAKGAIVAA